jgi:hypothetical protein
MQSIACAIPASFTIAAFARQATDDYGAAIIVKLAAKRLTGEKYLLPFS